MNLFIFEGTDLQPLAHEILDTVFASKNTPTPLLKSYRCFAPLRVP